jgi:formylglycine-generating enzyme required for sulfatase activity
MALRAGLLSVMAVSIVVIAGFEAAALAYSEAQPTAVAKSVRIRVPGTTVSFEMVHCPNGEIQDDAIEDVIVGDLWVLTTEVTWDLYDVYVYELDEPDGSSPADAVSRPSKPYVPPDRGFGHDGYPAIGMTRKAAEGFCEWLSLKTGLAVRLPTKPEWIYLASSGTSAPYCCGVDDTTLSEFAWIESNSEHSTHPVGLKKPNGFGLFDVHGNAAEWVLTDTRKPFAMGGGFRDDAESSTTRSAQRQVSSWNQSDPQIPKSQWWLADCSWVGFRFVIDATDEQTQRLEELGNE